jgi:glyoxylase I family protein
VQLRASDSLIDLVALHVELWNSGGIAPGHERRNIDNFCLRVWAVPEYKSYAFSASRSIQHSAMATRYGAKGFRWSLYLSDPESNAVELKLAA